MAIFLIVKEEGRRRRSEGFYRSCFYRLIITPAALAFCEV
jgi:hypothetical protein